MAVELDQIQIGIFCPVHKVNFSTARAKGIVCATGEEVLTQNFPEEGFWVYCCGCDCFWPSDFPQRGEVEEQCPACGRVLNLTQAYLCDQCEVLSVQPVEGLSASFNISPKGMPEPACPGCLQSPSRHVAPHLCENGNVIFASPRSKCPFCHHQIEDEARRTVEHKVEGGHMVETTLSQDARTEVVPPREKHWPLSKKQWIRVGALFGFPVTVIGVLLAMFPPPVLVWYLHKWVSHQAPVLGAIQHNKREVLESEKVSLKAIAQGHDKESLTCEWSCTPPGYIEGSGCGEVFLNTSNIRPQAVPFPVNIRLKITDSYGLIASQDLDIYVLPVALVNKPPVLVAIKPSAQEVRSGEIVTLTAITEDLDKDPITYKWQSSSICRIEGEGQTVSLNTSAVSPQSSTVQVLVTLMISDGRGGTASGTVPINIIPKQLQKLETGLPIGQTNNSPILISLQPQKSSIHAGESVEIDAIATDPNNDKLDYVWEPSGQIEGEGPHVTLRPRLKDAQSDASRIVVTLTVIDRRGGSASGKTLINVLPLIQTPNPTPRPTPTPETKSEIQGATKT